MLFKEGSVAEEIFNEMEKNEFSIAFKKENSTELEKVRMLEELNKAAEIFEKSGFIEKAAKVTDLMIKLSNKKNEIKKTASKKDKDNKKSKKKDVVKMFGVFGFSPDDLKELGIDGFDDNDTKDWEDE